MPLPPYIARTDGKRDSDNQNYQTMFAEYRGAVAAPTAGLHFTSALVKSIVTAGVEILPVTLHVGAGTFLPVTVDNIVDHKMHSEWGEITLRTASAINAARQNGGRVIAVGTTSLRILEACYQQSGAITPFTGETDIFITPGYEFGVIDGVITLIDEVLTPDSSRYWPGDKYAEGKNQESFDKQFVRDWLETLD